MSFDQSGKGTGFQQGSHPFVDLPWAIDVWYFEGSFGVIFSGFFEVAQDDDDHDVLL
jgi:hypothetical protein